MQWSRDSRGRLNKLEITKTIEIVDPPAVDNNFPRSPDIDIITIESLGAPAVDNYIHTDIDNSAA